MRTLLLILLLFALPAWADVPVEIIRSRYGAVLNRQYSAWQLLEWLRTSGGSRAIDYAYIGATQALIARDAWNPMVKWEYLQLSAATLARAVNMEPDNPEIRFLRFCMEHYVPAWLGFSKNLEADRQAIIKALQLHGGTYSPELRHGIIRFLLDSGRCSEQEIGILKSMLR